eukprot:GFUD01013258.1.p1 GENE.GFUD01013258.1~~GFUD01013258.1.p1  ORF type:complete len:1777 (+),score=633.99 GFUD01013258.1:47-5377(+)
MSSRLDRLFILLESGSSPATRRAAANQLGEVQKSHPGELHSLLRKVLKYLYHSNWDTRIAAAQAVEAILKNVPIWKPENLKSENFEGEKIKVEQSGRLSLNDFDVEKLIRTGECLMSSEGKEFDTEKTAGGMNNNEKLALQRQQLNKKLGLDMAQKLGFASDNFIEDEDFVDDVERHEERKLTASEILAAEIKSVTGQENLSAREMNRLKRKARLEAKASIKAEEDVENEPKKMKTETVFVSQPESDTMVIDQVVDEKGDLENSFEWPLESFCAQLVTDLFSPKWEKRHGAASGLRELVKNHGLSGGMMAGCNELENISHHTAWLEDLVLRLVCVLALDRFGDFVSDTVVAPVRESTAQVLGTVLPLVSGSGVELVSGIVLQLVQQEEWECRHGGLLAVKYLLAVRTDMAQQLLPRLYPQIYTGLTDSADDVVAVAAAALLPVSGLMVSLLPQSVPSLCDQLWAQLLELDDLTSSTHSIMALLAELLSQGEGPQMCISSSSPPLSSLVPRLYPFLSHSSSQVRKAALSTLLTLSSHPSVAEHWLPSCAMDLLRNIYQRSLLEHHSHNLDLVVSVWNCVCTNTPLQPLLMAGCPWFGPWIKLISGPANAPLDSSILLPSTSRQFLGGPEAQPITDPVEKDKAVSRARNTAAKLLGKLAAFIVRPVPGIVYTPDMESPLQMLLDKVLIPQLGTNSAYQKLAISMIILQWLDQTPPPPQLSSSSLPNTLLTCLIDQPSYEELSHQFAKLGSEATDYISSLRHYRLDVDEHIPPGSPLNYETIQYLVGSLSDELISRSKVKPKVCETIQERRQSVVVTLAATIAEQTSLELVTMSSLAGALAFLGPSALPTKLNPVIKPLMEAVKKEANDEFQKMAARSLSRVLNSCISRETSPNEKVVKNLCAFVCSNPEITPLVTLAHLNGSVDPNEGVLTLFYNERNAEKTTNKSRKAKKNAKKSAPVAGAPLQSTADIDNEDDIKKVETQRRGAMHALKEIATFFGPELSTKMPKLWEMSIELIKNSFQQDTDPQELVNGLGVISVLTPAMSELLHPHLQHLIPYLLRLTCHHLTSVRYMAANALTIIAKMLTVEVMTMVVEHLVPCLEDSSMVCVRQGVIETINTLSEQLEINIVPYIVLLVINVLGAMSDSDSQVRLLATNTFATLVRLMPLDGGVPEPPNLSDQLKEKKEREKQFLAQLLNSKNAESYTISVPVAADLRSYQVSGVNWLAFLNKYRLHGILCDDMGLGKTLQSICMLASDHKNLAEKGHNVQSLVVCPATLGGHWMEEVSKFVSKQYLNPFLYFGPPGARAGLRSQIPHHNLIITSYDIVRNDVEFFGSIKWNYLVLDEGHVIKNTKTKTAMAIRQLVASHRVILTGTPIQNGVIELWALFDFLMPGYLGSEKFFNARYARPILNSREAKSSAKDQEAGVLAMESLHRQTLPFILRRVKEDVLSDLPPKITQDYYCELSPLQTQLYEDFTKSQAVQTNPGAAPGSVAAPNTHVFQALQYLKKVCNHPKLVLTKEHPEYDSVLSNHLNGNLDNLLNIEHAAKLSALKQLLTDLGIANTSSVEEQVVSQHRALIFCQLKTMLDIVESDLLKTHLPNVTYLRLDGSVPTNLRHSIVSKFNNDPSIDLLLLSTSVGGLGLNLTGADTVIFVEHDWNPMKDLQAMDRAHRIGQKKVVNVYRLITRNTLEEKIMSLQKFKLHTARTVISSDNSSIASMQTDQVLDLFSLTAQQPGYQREGAGGSDSGIKSVLDSLPELWEEDQYGEEYNMDTFISNLNK